tara:strand:- start:411 stop:812 length:402 start_codon:yes stop_codon:yes gene_type:complete
MENSNTKQIFIKAKRGLGIIKLLQSGKDIQINNFDDKTITQMLLDLIHLRHYAYMHNLIGIRNDDEEMKKEATSLLKIVTCKDGNEDPTTFEMAIGDLLNVKSKGVEKNIEKIHKICCNLVSKEWIDAGLMKT